MDIKRLLELLDYARRAAIEHRGPSEEFANLHTEIAEMLEHQQAEAVIARAGIALGTVGVIHALEIGLEKTAKAHVHVEAGRREALAQIAHVEPASKVSMVREAIYQTAVRQATTTDAGRALVGLGSSLGSTMSTDHSNLLKLCEQIANNLAVYVTIPELCEVCGQVSAGNTCCPSDGGAA